MAFTCDISTNTSCDQLEAFVYYKQKNASQSVLALKHIEYQIIDSL